MNTYYMITTSHMSVYKEIKSDINVKKVIYSLSHVSPGCAFFSFYTKKKVFGYFITFCGLLLYSLLPWWQAVYAHIEIFLIYLKWIFKKIDIYFDGWHWHNLNMTRTVRMLGIFIYEEKYLFFIYKEFSAYK